MKVLNFGSLNIDHVYTMDHIVKEGETESSLSYAMHLGGKGFNQSVALSRASLKVFHAGMVGDDGLIFFDVCKDYGIDCRYLKTVTGPCGQAIIQVDKEGKNSIILFGGANQKNTREYIDDVLSNFSQGDVILLQNEINELPYLIDQAFLKGMKIVLNPSPFNKKLLECDLGKVSFFVMNETEGRELTHEETPSAILAFMEANYSNARVVLTLGSKGALYHFGNEEIYQPAFAVKSVDTTGAGDTFTGYLVAGILKKMDIRQTLQLAAKAAALSITKSGAAEAIPFMSEVELFKN